ncbi:MAG: flavin reductase [Oscillospiraceae bacterium]|jgi:flavin reductase (DIM6/NTAB) family NADH-FMN oxidoreductase RutF/rubredoxin|nr:flavin reductase [Oscillospiraceae bacterium]MDY4191258.1 flavin reductase [Oscillospiraceae bacterium]
MNTQAMFKLSYGLFVLSAREGEKDNGCIVNTVCQVTDTPLRVSVTVSKQNLTHDMILSAGTFCVSVLDESAPFSLFQRFGFQSGRSADKFKDVPAARAENGLLYLKEHSCAFLCGRVVQTVDLGTHSMFLADVTEGEVLSDLPAATYAYYHAHIKPAPPKQEKTGGWRCAICGYIYEGEELPADFVCPLCKHGAADFVKVGGSGKTAWRCVICGYVYEGDTLPADFVCPLCKHGISDFVKIDLKE